MANAMAAFGRNDLRNIRRDTLMIGVGLGPFGYALTMWFLPALTRYLNNGYGVDLTPYYSLIISSFVVVAPAAVMGALCGMLLIDEKDQRTLAALRVTPAPPLSYPLYRVATTVAVATISLTAALWLTFLVPGEIVLASIPIAALSGINAAMFGLACATLARNKVEALAVFRALGMIMIGIPMVPYFFDLGAFELGFGVLPPYWLYQAYWTLAEGGNHWPFTLVGAVYAGVLAWLLMLRFGKQKF